MAYVQVKLLQTFKLAVILTAFFVSSLSYSLGAKSVPDMVKDGDIEGVSPDITSHLCVTASRSNIQANACGEDESMAYMNACEAWISAAPQTTSNAEYTFHGKECIIYPNANSLPYLIEPFTRHYSNGDNLGGTNYLGGMVYLNDMIPKDSKTCPPKSHPFHTISVDLDDDEETDICVSLNDVNDFYDKKNELDKNENYCESLALDSGNNSGNSYCYTAYNGASCSVVKKQSGDLTYYKGVSNNPLGCGSSDEPPYDPSGTGSDKDKCVYSQGTNYCQADRSKHCSTVGNTEICDEGCIDDGENVMCDVSRHNDVGEGESDYHDDKGSCSVSSASSSKGFCIDSGGDWDSTAPDENNLADCDMRAGTCSTGSASFCGQCLDDGGVWTPDTQLQVSDERIGLDQVATTVQDGNNKLTQIESGIRSTNETQISTIKSGNNKIVTAIEELSALTKANTKAVAAAAEDEEKSFTTTTQDIDKTKFNSLFDAASMISLNEEINNLKQETTTYINTIKAEASSIFNITVPNGSGYESRMLNLTQGSFDVSLSRFSDFFKMLAAPVMLVCSIFAVFIIMRSK